MGQKRIVTQEWVDWIVLGDGDGMGNVGGFPVCRIKVGDTLKACRIKVTNEDGSLYDFTSHSVVFSMKDRDGNSKVSNQVATIVSTGIIEYSFAAADVDTAGVYLADFRATSGADFLHLPESGFIRVEISEVA